MPFKKMIIFLIIGLILSACENILNQSETALVLEPKEPLQQDTFNASGLDFETVKKSIFVTRCTSCHQQYNSYQGVRLELSAIETAVKSNRMPKSGGPLSDEQRNLLSNWVAGGALEFAGIPNSPNPISNLEPVWKSISEYIIIPKCLVCHNPQGQAKFLDLSTRQKMYENRNRVFAGGSKLIDLESPEKSYLIEILRDEEEPMPPVWSNIPQLSANEIKILQQWLSLGLP